MPTEEGEERVEQRWRHRGPRGARPRRDPVEIEYEKRVIPCQLASKTALPPQELEATKVKALWLRDHGMACLARRDPADRFCSAAL